MNNNEIYYFALGNSNNKEQIEAFLQNVDNRGMYLESSDVTTSINAVVNYMADKLKQ